MADCRIKDTQGKTICPVCGKHYFPVLGERQMHGLIQNEFPNAHPWQREQLITGICSDACWKKEMGE